MLLVMLLKSSMWLNFFTISFYLTKTFRHIEGSCIELCNSVVSHMQRNPPHFSISVHSMCTVTGSGWLVDPVGLQQLRLYQYYYYYYHTGNSPNEVHCTPVHIGRYLSHSSQRWGSEGAGIGGLWRGYVKSEGCWEGLEGIREGELVGGVCGLWNRGGVWGRG